MLALGIILLVLCLLFLGFIIFRKEIRAWQKERSARRKSVEKLIHPGDKHGK